ncbi:papain cysteine protease family protein [Tribonema minus]|uniref:Papain cysteine protease family protein n=1 Tax=Tribonema minus TaxID=303371 RepID=A0A836CBQ3_9STRA|nr:papain cysteine protease family protein [Tribonema minus]
MTPCPYISGFYGAKLDQSRMLASIAVEFACCGSLKDWSNNGLPVPEPWIAYIAYCVFTRTGRKYTLRLQEPDSRDLVFTSTINGADMPLSVDLRTSGFMPPVLDQQSAGTCSAHASANALHYLLKREKVADFSPARLYIYYTTRVYVEGTPATEDSGCVLRDVGKAIKTYHVPDEKYEPYSDKKISQRPSAMAVANARLHTTLKYRAVAQTEHDLKGALAAGFPVMIGIQVYESFESDEVAATGEVPMPEDGEECLGAHATLCIGFDDATRKFKLMNSWGVAFGDKGFFTLPYEYVLDPNLASDFWTFKVFK